MRIMARILGLAGLMVLLVCGVSGGFWLFEAFDAEYMPFVRTTALALLCCGAVLFAASIVFWRRTVKRDTLWNTLFDSMGMFPDFLRGAGFGLGSAVISFVAYLTVRAFFEPHPVLLGLAVFFFIGAIVHVPLYFHWERKRQTPRE